MNETADLLLRARLEGIAGGGRGGDWGDVVRRVRRARRRRALVAAGAAALVVAGVASALALTHPIVDFGSAEKGPQDVVVQFGRQNVIAPPDMKPRLLPESARRITTVRVNGRPHVLYVAPTAAGGFCWLWTQGDGSCRAHRERADRLDAGGLAGRYGFSRLSGAFMQEDGARLAARYSDGSEAEIPFVWVTEPISAGFFFYETGARAGHEVVSLTLYDDDGKALATQKLPDVSGEAIPVRGHRVAGFGTVMPSPKAIWSKRELLFDIPIGPHRHAGLWIAPSTDGGTCWFSTRGSGCDNAGEPWQVSPKLLEQHPELKEQGPLIGLGVEGGSTPTLCCQVGPPAARVELRYQDGARETAIPKRGYLLVVIAPEHYPLGHRLEEMVAYDAAGKVVGRRDMKPAQMRGVYPCEHEKDYGYGVTMCP
jgi:hypothetical protein